MLVIETRRSMPVMAAYYARGREKLGTVNALYTKAGLRPITAKENIRKITNARPGESWHYFGLAVDAVPLVGGKPDWIYNPVDPKDYFDEMAEEATKLGMVWGKSFNDFAHLELHPGYSTVSKVRGVQAAYAISQRMKTTDIPLRGLWGPNAFQYPDPA